MFLVLGKESGAAEDESKALIAPDWIDSPSQYTDSSLHINNVRGIIRARHQAVLSSQIEGEIIDLPIGFGESFNKDATLVKFDCVRQKAEAQAAAAQVDLQQRKVQANKTLEQYESISQYEIFSARAELNRAESAFKALNARVNGCEIKAPFAGRVVESMINRFEAVAANQPLIKIVDPRHLEIELIVPSSWLTWIKPGSHFTFVVDDNDSQLSATVTRLAPVVDPVSKTVKLLAELSPLAVSQANIRPGMSGRAVFAKEGGTQ